MNISNYSGGKLWQVGKVYRRDNPVVSKGRMREFQQAVSSLLRGHALCLTQPGFRHFRRLRLHDSGR
jgi:hypothetical protein